MPLAGLASFQQSADLQPVYSEQRSACQGPAGLVASPSDNREVTAPGWLRYWRTGTWVVRTHHPVVICRRMYMRDTVFCSIGPHVLPARQAGRRGGIP